MTSTIINGILLLIICVTLFLAIQRLLVSTGWIISNLDYQCSSCGGSIYLTPSQAMLAFHWMGKKWVRCPHCGQMTWAIPIRKQ